MTRRLRAAAWLVIGGLAVLQAWANRFAISPDGVSYLDLSDAVVSGHWGALVNLYWSPLYPLLIGAARAIAGAGAEHEVAVMHAVNVAAFAAMFLSFEYFLMPVLSLASRTRRAPLGGRWGPVAAYALFGALALTMTPLELTTPDLLSNAAVFVALGALLRLCAGSARPRRHAVLLGVALGLGVLAKAFLVPWSIVCFAVLVVALRRRATVPLALAVVVWAAFVLPWSAMLSRQAGRPTFGDAGRLTYAWYVNSQGAPSLGGVPQGARAADTDVILPGTGVTGPAPGTDPMWYDPARWSAGLRPRFVLREQLDTLAAMSIAVVANVSVLTYLLLLVAIAPPGTRRRAWAEAWVAVVPSVAGIAGYVMVIVTSRYIMAFTLGIVLVTLAALPRATRIRPAALLMGLVVAIGVEALSPRMIGGLSMVTGVAAGALAGVFVPMRRRGLWIASVVIALGLGIILLQPRMPEIVLIGAAAIAFAIWLRARASIPQRRPAAFARGLYAALALSIAIVFTGRLVLRLARDVGAWTRSASPATANTEWQIARELAANGIVPGSRIAVIGPHAEAYWARTARLTIVASVPDPLVARWAALPATAQDSLLARFAEHGAQFAIVTREGAIDRANMSWRPLRHHGWMKPLTAPR